MSPRVLMGGTNSAARSVAEILTRERGCDVCAESNAAALLKRRESSNGFHIIILSSTLTPGAGSGNGRVAAASCSAPAASSGTDAENTTCDACRKLRMTDASTPIIVLSPESRERVLWPYYESGADMCVSWPVSERLLLARFDSLLRRSGFEPCRDVITRGELCLDYVSSTLTIDGHRQIKLPTRQLELLYCLMSNSGIVMSREQLLHNAWEKDYNGSDRTLDTHIKCLRAVLGEHGRYIKTLRKIGYCFDVT